MNSYKRLLDDIHVFITGLLTLACYMALHRLMAHRSPPLLTLSEYLPSIGIIIFCLMFNLSQKGFSTFSSLASPGLLLRELGVSYFFALVTYGFFAYALKLTHFSRLYILGGALSSGFAAYGWHLGAFFFHRWWNSSSGSARGVVVVGDSATLPEMIKTIRSDEALGLRIIGALGLKGMECSREMGDVPFAPAEHIGRFLDSNAVDYALFTGYRTDPEGVENAMWVCRERGIRICLKPDFLPPGFTGIEYLRDIPLIIFSTTPREGWTVLLKRFIDIIGAATLLLAFFGPMLCLILIIRLTSRGSALFEQRRVGLNGGQFDMHKFRSMRPDSEGEAARLDPLNELIGPVFKMREDPRVTPLGRILRKYSLDELPQLWNVLKGDMSLVGPRPPLPSEVSRYHGWQRRRLSMRPGITGLWQVEGRNALEFDEWVRLDLLYIDTWSLWLDFKIMMKTVPAVLRGTGV